MNRFKFINLDFLLMELMGFPPVIIGFPLPYCLFIPFFILQIAISIRVGDLRLFGYTKRAILLFIVLNEIVFFLVFLFYFSIFYLLIFSG